MNYILVIRIIAIWDNNKLLSIILKSIIVCEAVAELTFVIRLLVIMKHQTFSLPSSGSSCGYELDRHVYANVVNLTLVVWLILPITGFVLLVSALYKATEQWRITGLTRENLMTIIIKDQIIYYLVVLSCSIANMIGLKIATTGLSAGSYVLIQVAIGSPGLFCLVGSRMYMNLKEAGDTQLTEGRANRLFPETTLSSLEVAYPRGSSSYIHF